MIDWKLWDWNVFDNFTWEQGGTLLAAALGVGIAVWTYVVTRASARRDHQATVYAEALRVVEDYLEGPYRVRRRDGSDDQRAVITTWMSDVKSRMNYYQGLLQVHGNRKVARAYDKLVEAATADAGPQMTQAWRTRATRRDRDVPLGFSYDRANSDKAKNDVLFEMKRSGKPGWRRWATRR